jgi:hypothetical protein
VRVEDERRSSWWFSDGVGHAGLYEERRRGDGEARFAGSRARARRGRRRRLSKQSWSLLLRRRLRGRVAEEEGGRAPSRSA